MCCGAVASVSYTDSDSASTGMSTAYTLHCDEQV